MHPAAGCPGAVGVEGGATMAGDPAVHQAVGRPGVEAAGAPIGEQQAQVGDAAEVEHGHVLARHAENGPVEGRHQRCALAAGRDVAAAQVADNIDASLLGQQRAVQQLGRVALDAAGPVAHRLAVGTDGANLAARRGGGFEQLGDQVGIVARHRVGGQCGAVQLVGARGVQREQFIAQCRGERGVDMASDGQPGSVEEYAVDTVERRARHEPDEQARGHGVIPRRRRRPSFQPRTAGSSHWRQPAGTGPWRSGAA
mmetsp:Transcript_49002/g.115063  ORF Transcript_49002/g.115063 Transcript_49002/m.115063 type:complete len:255 (+) Transcript_49002:2072-2836(+)